jgi:hypothetical protein
MAAPSPVSDSLSDHEQLLKRLNRSRCVGSAARGGAFGDPITSTDPSRSTGLDFIGVPVLLGLLSALAPLGLLSPVASSVVGLRTTEHPGERTG